MIPFLELSKRLALRGHAVTFVSTPRNAVRLGAVPPELSARIRIATLELPVVEGLSEGAESTADVPPEEVGLLKKAFDCLAAPFADLVANLDCSAACGDDVPGFSRKPDWIILDFAHSWVWPIAEEHKIACVMFSIFPVSLSAFTGPKHENEAHPRTKTEDYMVPPPWIPFPSTLAYRHHGAEWFVAAFRPNASGVSDIDRFWQVHRPSCRLIIHRSCPEAELRLFPLYVALGSEAPVTANDVRELARGLELSGARFLWAFRPPVGHTGALLPDGFEARVAGRGVVRVGWVPQVRVLAHRAVGAFLTHCGWGSTVESLFRFGHPLVMLPFIADQGLIARAMAEWGVGVEVPRSDEGSFSGDDVAAAVRRVTGGEEGEELARNAMELRKVLGDRVMQEKYVDELEEHLYRYK